MNTQPIITIAIVDDHTLFRQGIAQLLVEFNEIKVAFEAANGLEMKEQLKKYPLPDVILMDIAMPHMDGYTSTQWLQENYPQVRILALSMFEDDLKIINMLKNGAGGYIIKESRTSELVSAIKGIHQHGFFINEQVSGKLLRSIQDQKSGQPMRPELSRNELTFLELCCSELTYKEIAEKMHLSHHTIDNYRESLCQKFGIKTRTGLVIYGIKNKLISI